MWLNSLETADLVKFTEEILNGKLNFLSSASDENYHNIRVLNNKIFMKKNSS